MGSTSVASVAYWCTFSGLWCRMWQFSIFIGNRRKHKTTDIWRCANEDQCVPDKTGCSCRTITRSVRLARQGCWCCACRSSSPVLHESYCRITSKCRVNNRWSGFNCFLSRSNCGEDTHNEVKIFLKRNTGYQTFAINWLRPNGAYVHQYCNHHWFR